MTQWAVVWRPDPTHLVRVLGPYRSARKAHEVEAAMEALEDEFDITTGFDDDTMSLLPQVVSFEDWSDVERELRATYGDDSRSRDPSFCPPLADGDEETCTHTPACPTGSSDPS